MNANRRRHPRIPLDTELRIRMGFRDYYPLRADNISMGGMCIHLNEQIPKGKKGKLWLTHAVGREVLQFESPFKVLWIENRSGDPTMGVEFIKTKRKHQDTLLRLLRHQGTVDVS